LLTLAHEYLLLSLHDSSGTILVQDSIVHNCAMAGAFMGEMLFRDRLAAVKANKFQLRGGALSEGSLGVAEKQLQGCKPYSQKQCLNAIKGWGGGWTVETIVGDLVAMGVLRTEQDKFWFIPYRTRRPEANPTLERDLRQRLRAHLAAASHKPPPHRDDALIGLLRVSKILHTVWTPAELESLRPLIEQRTRMTPLGVVVKEAADEEKTALAVATIVAVT
jgi:hypothetical protein